MSAQDNKFRLDFLKLQGFMESSGRNSRLIRAAVRASKARKDFKNKFKQFTWGLKAKAPQFGPQLRALVHVRGGIGDVIMSRIFVAALRNAVPSAHITYAHEHIGVAQMVYGGDKLVDEIIGRKYILKHYDVVISGCYTFNYDYYNLERIKAVAPEFETILNKGLAAQKVLEPVVINTPYLDGAMARWCVSMGMDRFGSMGLSTGLDVSQANPSPITLKEENFEILKSVGLEGKKYITIHDGMNTDTVMMGRPSRMWPREHWREFVKMFKAEFPDILVVQIGGGNSVKYDFVDVSLVNQTKVADLPYILAKSMLHVDSESGIVHIAFNVGTKAVVMFGPTTIEYWGYKTNINIKSEVCGDCVWSKKTWMQTCPLELGDKDCMSSILPQTTFNKVKEYLGGQNA
ncbi:ADP-heptose:LPS heptosyltransferase [Elusimicrobium simillimum]|uniref:glycosyltransferase family 9 protein n=1 Tax=Elusimicrobium simillimum TaxID=3143438 RepID=UPI003C6FA2D9